MCMWMKSAAARCWSRATMAAGATRRRTRAAPSARTTRQAKARAQALLSEGTAAYGRGDYATALDKFTAAYRIFPSPKLWFNIGQANRDLGRPVRRWPRSTDSSTTRATPRPRRWPRRGARRRS